MPWNSLILGALLAGIVWSLSWPEDPVVVVEREPKGLRKQAFDWAALDDEAETFVRHRAWLDLQKMSNSDLREALNRELTEIEKGKLSNSMKLLLVECARKNPEATFDWSWEHLRESRNWLAAYEQVGAQWAGDDPGGFCEFVLRHLQSTEVLVPGAGAGIYFRGRDTTIDHLLKSEEIFLGEGEGKKGVDWLLKSSPREAFTVYRKFRSNYGGEFEEMANTLNTGGELASALSAWDHYDSEEEALALQKVEELKKELEETPDDQEKQRQLRDREVRYQDLKHPSTSKLVKALIVRWQEVDPDGFNKSRYVDWVK